MLSQLLLWSGAAIAALVVGCLIGHRVVWQTGVIVRKRFPNGMLAWFIGGDLSNALVYMEMFEAQAYFLNGVTLSPPPPGAVDASGVPLIVDVGTNVGFFALSVARKLPAYDIVCFEPVPMLVDVATRNLTPYHVDGAESKKRIVVNRMGLGSKSTSVEFEFDCGMTAAAAIDPKAVKDGFKNSRLVPWLKAFVHDSQYVGGYPPFLVKPLRALLDVPVLGIAALCTLVPILYAPLLIRVVTMPKVKSMVKADVRRLSEMLSVHEGTATSTRPIAMLKIDVEGAEWDVLMGIDEPTWARVQQVVIETHDIHGRVDKTMALLRAKGFKHVVKGVEELESHLLIGLETIFATRAVPTKAKA